MISYKKNNKKDINDFWAKLGPFGREVWVMLFVVFWNICEWKSMLKCV